MPKYLIEFTRFEASIIAEYDESGRIIKAEINYGGMDNNQIIFLWRHFPGSIDRAMTYKTVQGVSITEVAEDLSFERFWLEYDHKVGNKGRAEKLWKALKDPDKIKALKNIQTYTQWLVQRPGIEKKYPETYLNQTPWNN